jgi:hypothetical protein
MPWQASLFKGKEDSGGREDRDIYRDSYLGITPLGKLWDTLELAMLRLNELVRRQDAAKSCPKQLEEEICQHACAV